MRAHARRLTVTGQVQGVGFRPFVFQLAQTHRLAGWVKNVTGQVEIHIQGESGGIRAFKKELIDRSPPLARPEIQRDFPAKPQADDRFHILDSDESDTPDIHLPKDHCVCDLCLAEMQNPCDRRYRYPFTNCTQCGPRYTLIKALPYDRVNTSMANFKLCPDCAAEYADPWDRRFHAEPVACPKCGPQLLWCELDEHGEKTKTGDDSSDLAPDADQNALALARAIRVLRRGAIVAVKGIGGYHLYCDARHDGAIARLRARKRRPRKPLAVMFKDLEMLRTAAITTAEQDAFLSSPERPILLLPKRAPSPLSHLIAPNLDEIGCLLPYSPLHRRLIEDFDGPLIATSGNISGDPVAIDNREAEKRLAKVADGFLHHNRTILRPADDSVFRPINRRQRPLRLGRGSAPLELSLTSVLRHPVIALGSHMKNTLCLAWADRAVISPHIGNLDSVSSLDNLARVSGDLQRLYRVEAQAVLIDRHPGYAYRSFARSLGLPLIELWHHHAHASAMAWEFPEVRDWIAFTWDGVGLGQDRTIWGAEAFVGRPGNWQRAARLQPFRIPGGDRAARQPWRSAVALLWELGKSVQQADRLFIPADAVPDLDMLHRAWKRNINAPETSAAGRLFDGIAALIGICSDQSFEGEAPIRLEAAAARSLPNMHHSANRISMPMHKDSSGLWTTSWGSLVEGFIDQEVEPDQCAAIFHLSLARALIQQAMQLRKETGIIDIGLCGGVFQNRLFTEFVISGLAEAGFCAHLPAKMPVNDAAISLGQVVEWIHHNERPC